MQGRRPAPRTRATRTRATRARASQEPGTCVVSLLR
jgi:hypothetical protein